MKRSDSRYRGGRKKTCALRETLDNRGFALDGNEGDGIYVGKVDHGFDKTSAADLRNV